MIDFLKRLMVEFKESYINCNFELILIPKTNTYFSLMNCKNELDIKCKLLEWCSRTISKGQPYQLERKNIEYRKENLKRFNQVLGTSFNEDEIDLIYCELGNAINHQLTIKFVESGYDLSLLINDYSVFQLSLNPIKWQRDIAIAQLKDLGYAFGQKKTIHC